MIVKRRIVICGLIALAFVCNNTLAQIIIKVGGTNYTIPVFNADTLTGSEIYITEDALLQQHHFIKPIKSSTYEFEARCFYKEEGPFDNFRMIIVKGTKGKLKVEEFYLRNVYLVADGVPKITLPHGEIAIQNDNYRVTDKDSVFTHLIKTGLFSNRGDHVHNELAVNGNKDNINYLRGKIIFEVKLDNQYRCFSYKSMFHNTKTELVGDGKELFAVFSELIKKEKKI